MDQLLVGWLPLLTVAVAVFVIARFVCTTMSRSPFPSRADPIRPVVRNYAFGLQRTENVCSWNPHGRFVSIFIAAMSIFFPAGERMFCQAVKKHLRHPAVASDPKLTRAALDFISQEALHGREHEYYNRQLAKQLPITESLGKVVEFITHKVVPSMGKARALGATVALEHWTALLAGVLLEDDGAMLGDARDTRFGLIWRWHAMEETEHKAVAFDVFERCYGHGIIAYLRRCFSLVPIIRSYGAWRSLVYLIDCRYSRRSSSGRSCPSSSSA